MSQISCKNKPLLRPLYGPLLFAYKGIDKDEEGYKVGREAGISQESRQRAKILTHEHQADLRDAIANSIEAEKKKKGTR